MYCMSKVLGTEQTVTATPAEPEYSSTRVQEEQATQWNKRKKGRKKERKKEGCLSQLFFLLFFPFFLPFPSLSFTFFLCFFSLYLSAVLPLSKRQQPFQKKKGWKKTRRGQKKRFGRQIVSFWKCVKCSLKKCTRNEVFGCFFLLFYFSEFM